MKELLKSWWKWLRYEPTDPRFNAGGVIKITVIGGGTGLANMLRGLKKYSDQITAVVAVTDDGSSSGVLRKEFDILPPGDIRKCISALAYDEDLISNLLEYRFSKDKKTFGGHTLGNIWITALSKYFNSFEKALEATTEIFKTAGRVLPATLGNAGLVIYYADGTTAEGESHLDEVVKKIDRISLNKQKVRAYDKAVKAIGEADLVLLGPGSLYGSIIPNLLISGIRDAIYKNKRAVKVYIANCSTERTQTAGYTIEDHIFKLINHSKKRVFDYCLVNDKILRSSVDETKTGEINNITTSSEEVLGARIVRDNVISEKNPLYHDSDKLAKAVIDLYNKYRK
jgi:uncharacterized cofD-like protein